MSFGNKGRGGGKPRSRTSPKAEKLEKEQLGPYEKQPISANLSENLKLLDRELGSSKDVIVRKLDLQADAAILGIAVIYVEGMADETKLNEFVISPIQKLASEEAGSPITRENVLDILRKQVLSIGEIGEIAEWRSVFQGLLSGNCILFIDGDPRVLSLFVAGGARRSVEEPQTQIVIRGPREGFTESIRINTALLRRRIRSPKLWLEERKIGELTQTTVAVMYIKGLADENVLKDLRSRLDAIRIDGILESGYIEELIKDQKWTLFPTVNYNERPDAVAANLLEGRIAILIDGTPFVLVIPAIFNTFFQSAEDYYQSYDISTFLRLLRYFSFVIALTMPSIYVAVVGFHQEMIPTQLLLKLAAQREGVPFPAYLEAFAMELVFEILREAAVRMPSSVGSTISIVGGLVIGQSVVEAGIVSPAVVIVVSFTAISSFVSPAYSLGIAARLLRFFLLAAATSMGFYGIAIVILMLILHLSSLKSFGVPYLKPFAPMIAMNMKDTLIRAPLWLMRYRPRRYAGERDVFRSDMDVDRLEGESSR